MQGKNKITLIGYGLDENDTAFLNRLERAFAAMGLSITVKKRPFLISDDTEHIVTLTFDERKYKGVIRNNGRKKTAIISAEAIRRRLADGETADKIAADLGIGRATLFRHLKKAEE